ncbi:MAG: hypothetical protein B6D39_07245 [Anaerolineae bacterium UTCFX2]|jgi:hypothetical protein|nr:protease complex subunit PrcB family protein [Anaerolineae bacterium]OQY91463.1 MAG: hypothetical protein B6D39_07245 [Anaerolineae bacterium UTCFX2]
MIRMKLRKLAWAGVGIILLLSACAPAAPAETQAAAPKLTMPALPATVNPAVNAPEPRNYPNPPEPGSLTFEVIDFGAPTAGSAAPLALAVRSDQSRNPALQSLPDAAQKSLEQALEADPGALFLILAAGEMPSSGFSVQIRSITEQTENGGNVLLVRYEVQPPDPQFGAATVLTYPYLIVSLRSELPAQSVSFEQVRR